MWLWCRRCRRGVDKWWGFLLKWKCLWPFRGDRRRGNRDLPFERIARLDFWEWSLFWYIWRSGSCCCRGRDLDGWWWFYVFGGGCFSFFFLFCFRRGTWTPYRKFLCLHCFTCSFLLFLFISFFLYCYLILWYM